MWRYLLMLLVLLSLAIAVTAQNNIGYGDEFDAEISGRNGDEYSFEGEEGDIIVIKMFSNDFDTAMALFDEDGNAVAYNDDAYGLNAMIVSILPADGNYTILADSPGGASRGDAYTLSLNLLDEDKVLEYGTEVSGRVSDDFGEVWVFMGNEGDVVSISMNSDIIDTFVELFSSSIGRLAFNDDSGGTWDSQIANTQLPEDGVYFIIARSFAGGSSGAYSLIVEGTSGDSGELVGDNQGALEFEEVVSGTIEDANGDLWTFEGEEGDWILIAMSSPSTDCYLDLFSPDGDLLVRDDDSGIGYNAAILIELPDDGEYTLVTRAFAGRTGSYEMSVTIVEDLTELVYASVVGGNNVNLRDDAGQDSNVVDSTYPGDFILLVGRSEDNAWLQLVSLDNEPLWVAARVTEISDVFGTSDDIDDLPITD